MKALIKSLCTLVLGLFITGCAGESAPPATNQESGSNTGTDSAEYAAEMSGGENTDSEAAAPAEGDAPAEENSEVVAPAEDEKAAE